MNNILELAAFVTAAKNGQVVLCWPFFVADAKAAN